ncbi:roadblock/LC7 domain-containing protein [Actinomadura sp. LD22]|uniref:Roadblock/LC7 domain-containing protein n=1 Tax=Actinomadura physcomitrii TaxID=2650748 RepID=A0A6I4MCM3_9ACTN|nr:roadblock/LC7 domain-containing protein [Actinomadura physcomitrii]MVZ99895.1 roadblock/LC7 domain-containing protein [Actinomadura physcomitrii]
MTQHRGGADPSWLLDDLVDRVREVRQAVLLSRDGLLMGASRSMGREEAEHLAAISSGFYSLANGAREHFARDEVRQTIIEMEDALFFVSAAGSGSCLAVFADAGGNTGLVAYEMAMLVKRVRSQLTAAPRTGGWSAEGIAASARDTS